MQTCGRNGHMSTSLVMYFLFLFNTILNHYSTLSTTRFLLIEFKMVLQIQYLYMEKFSKMHVYTRYTTFLPRLQTALIRILTRTILFEVTNEM